MRTAFPENFGNFRKVTVLLYHLPDTRKFSVIFMSEGVGHAVWSRLIVLPLVDVNS